MKSGLKVREIPRAEPFNVIVATIAAMKSGLSSKSSVLGSAIASM